MSHGHPPSWPEPWPQNSPSSVPQMMPYNGNGVIGDLRERLARLEEGTGHIRERLQSGSVRMDTQDGRMNEMGDRLNRLEEADRATLAQMGPLSELPDRLTRIEARAQRWRDALQWIMAALILASVLAGKLSVLDGLKLFGKGFAPG